MRDLTNPKTVKLEVTMLLVALGALGLVVVAAVVVALNVTVPEERRAASEAAMVAPAADPAETGSEHTR